MKTRCFILSFFIILLSTVPCCLDNNCNNEIETEYANNSPQDHKEGECTICSPFLTCGTCSGFVINSLRIDISEIPFFKDKSVAVNKFHFSNKFFNEIWQPPKIS